MPEALKEIENIIIISWQKVVDKYFIFLSITLKRHLNIIIKHTTQECFIVYPKSSISLEFSKPENCNCC